MADQKRVEILVVGNELLNGTTLDTNSFWLSRELGRSGLRVERKTTVRDELPEISTAFRQCISRKPDWVFSIGGLGPTYDDMTVRGLALALGRRLKLDPVAVAMLKESYRRRALLLKKPVRRLGNASLKMAMIPVGETSPESHRERARRVP
jgi:molybdopterin-biosynthesis enzyme MoeA-like protein